MKGRLLIVDDERGILVALRGLFGKEGYEVETAESGEEALAKVRAGLFHVVITDLSMKGMSGLDLLREIRRLDPESAVLMITAYGSQRIAVEAMKAGAEDYLPKPFDNDELRIKVRKVMEKQLLKLAHRQLLEQVRLETGRFENMLGRSRAMLRVFETIEKVAPTDVTVLIRGESGTGKELVARAIHFRSSRASGPFVAVNCAAFSRELVESELFGFRRGAFTGAYTDAAGLFASASGGTVFLDEIGEMPKEVQVKLLRVLQEKELRPIGSTHTLPVDVRIISATNRSLSQLRSEYLRSDFYFRIATVTIEIPPLRRRPEDLLALIHHFGRTLSERYEREITLHRSALELLLHYSFPGNIRELVNLLESVAAVSRDDPQVITDRDLRPLLQNGLPEGRDVSDADPVLTLDQWERMAIERALRRSKGNRTQAASLLGISRDTLYRKLRELKEDS